MTAVLTLPSTSAEETRRLGGRLGALLKAGDVVLLSGELGAGKTVFVQGIARGMGFAGSVSSKSFVLLGEYAGRVRLYHADLYRLEEPEQVLELALDEISADGVLVVEWPERAGGGVLPDEHVRIEFEVTAEETRALQVSPEGERGGRLVEAMRGDLATPGRAAPKVAATDDPPAE
jgi:tRNA threonylcarbamoyladenosine biosynthesis protein TsaE